MTVILDLKHRPVKDVIDAVKPIVSRPGGAVISLGDEQRPLLSDLRPRIDQILQLIELIEVPGTDTIIRQIPSQYLNATQLAALVTAAAAGPRRNARDGTVGIIDLLTLIANWGPCP